MNILFISRCLPYPLHHGDRLILHHLVGELTARGHTCDAVALTQRPDDEAEVPRSASMFRDFEPVTERGRSTLAYLRRLTRPFPTSSDGCWNPELWQAAERRLASRQYDVAHLFGGIQVYEVRNLVATLPRLIAPYESYSLWLERAASSAAGVVERLASRAALTMARAYERRMYAGFERIVVLTDQDRDALLRLNPRTPVAVIPNGVRTFAPAPERRPTSPPSLVFVGNYAYGPNVRAAVALVSDILPRVRAHVPDVRVVLVGVNAPARVRSLAGADVEVTGPVPDIAPFLARASCFVAPLVQGAGMKNKVLEAMAAGLPAVGTPLAMEGIAVTPGEHVLTGSTPAELAAQVTRLLRDPRLAQQVGARARALVERHYTWAQVAERYESLYREVIGEHAGRDA